MKPEPDFELIESLFFAYRNFVGEADKILLKYNFGRAHHRVLHFVYRNPGLTIAALLDILQITKQSLARVLKELIEGGFIVQHEGAEDRRQRLLHLTQKGTALAAELSVAQSARLHSALATLDGEGHKYVRRFLKAMIEDELR
jgi:DNA-binding MarR family transcriptional regulator